MKKTRSKVVMTTTLTVLTTALLFAATLRSAAQTVKKPTLMILPSDHWCAMRYYTTTFDNQGTKVTVPDYQTAFLQDTELNPVISKVGGLLTQLGYSVKDAEQSIKTLNTRQAEDNVMTSKSTGAQIAETPLDILKRRIKSDIVIQLSWEMSRSGKTFTLEAFDAYTNKRIATATGVMTGKGSIAGTLEEAVMQSIKPFDKQMDTWYSDQRKNGREIALTVRCWDNWENDLETEYDGEELTDCIQEWIRKNTVNEAFNLSDGTETFAQFEQIRIPLFDEKGKAMDARAFATALRKHLQKPPYNITSKVVVRGLGEAVIVLGEK